MMISFINKTKILKSLTFEDYNNPKVVQEMAGRIGVFKWIYSFCRKTRSGSGKYKYEHHYVTWITGSGDGFHGTVIYSNKSLKEINPADLFKHYLVETDAKRLVDK